MNISRRNFLQLAAGAGGTFSLSSSLGGLLSTQAFAQSAPSFSDYKAVVLINLAGGNDGNNTIIPLDAAGYAHYKSLRRTLTLVNNSCLPLSVAGAQVGLHTALSNISSAINAGQGIALLNVGQLKAPLTKAAIVQNVALNTPPGLLSHPTSRTEWESASVDPDAVSGWGGRLAELLARNSDLLPPLLNTTPNCLFTAGKTGEQGVTLGGPTSFGVAQISDAMSALADIDATSSNNLVAQTARLRQVALKQQSVISQAQAAGAQINTLFPTSALGTALLNVAKVIHGRNVVGSPRQIFLCQQDGFDTHEAQPAVQNSSLLQLDAAVGAFMRAMAEIGMTNQVLLCTYSEFSRSMIPNSNNGTDHGWGNHHFILGGGIKCRRLIGSMPTFDIGGSSDLGGNGVWIPTTSVSQMVGGIGEWFGLNKTQLTTILPDLPNFPDYIHLS